MLRSTADGTPREPGKPGRSGSFRSAVADLWRGGASPCLTCVRVSALHSGRTSLRIVLLIWAHAAYLDDTTGTARRTDFEFDEMNGTVNLDEASQPCFDASSSKLAWGSLDGRLRLFDVNAHRIVADMTEDVSASTIADKNISKSVYSCLGWGQGKVRVGNVAGMRQRPACRTAPPGSSSPSNSPHLACLFARVPPSLTH